MVRKRLESLRQRVLTEAPMLAAAIVCLAGAVFSKSSLGAFFLAAFALVLARPSWRFWAGLFVVMIAVAWRSHVIETPVKESHSSSKSQFVEGELTLGSKPSLASRSRIGWLREETRKRKVMVKEADSYEPGQVLRMRGSFSVPEKVRNPGEFSQLDYWRRLGIFGEVEISESEPVRLLWYAAPLRWAESLRGDLREGITRGLDEESRSREVIQAMILGDKPPRDSDVTRAFRESGAMHVFAVSGLHVT